MKAPMNRPDTLYAPLGTDPGARGRFGARAAGDVAAADPHWVKLGIAATLGLVAGTMLFATEAHGRAAARTDRRSGRR